MAKHRKTQSERAGIIFPVGRIKRYLRNGTTGKRISSSAAVQMAATLEYLVGELFDITKEVIDHKNKQNGRNERIKPTYLHQAIHKDPELNQVFGHVIFPSSSFIARSEVAQPREQIHHAKQKSSGRVQKKSRNSPKKRAPHPQTHLSPQPSTSHRSPQHRTPEAGPSSRPSTSPHSSRHKTPQASPSSRPSPSRKRPRQKTPEARPRLQPSTGSKSPQKKKSRAHASPQPSKSHGSPRSKTLQVHLHRHQSPDHSFIM